jgi:hypothetical protein
MTRKMIHIALLSTAISLFSCKDMPNQTHGAIVLGDSSTIVTERDPQKLQDLVNDLKPEIPPAENTDTVKAEGQDPKPEVHKDSVKKPVVAGPPPPPAQTPMSSTMGLLAEFKEVSALLPNVTAKISGSPNLKNANGAVYTLVSGNINGNTLKVSGSNVTRVSQRYQSIVVLKNETGTMALETMSITSDWAPVKAAKDGYHITGLDPQSLDYPEASSSAIRNAVTKAAQRRHLSRRRIQEIVNSVRHARSPHQKPFSVNLRSAMWKIDGKDAQGKVFSKQIRIDVPW